MPDWLLILIPVALAAAWYLGYRMRAIDPISSKSNLASDYLVGLNYLLNEQPDQAVDVFIRMLEVDSGTVETHLAIGKLFRHRGEVDRAIRIHQNLIARPQLAKSHRQQAFLALGHDYLKAGMLDRAERVFLEIKGEKPYAREALRALLDIYQKEKLWSKAIEIASDLEQVSKAGFHVQIAHYYCELAEEARKSGQAEQALHYSNKALAEDTACVRASLFQADINMQQKKYKSAISSLKRIKKQNPVYLPEAIEPLAYCYESLNQEKQLVSYLMKLLEEYPKVPVVLILSERIRTWKGDKTAAKFVADYIRRFPSLDGLQLFITLYSSTIEGRAKQDLAILQKLIDKLIAEKPNYQCTSCGFSAISLHWQCPGCKSWSTVRSLSSVET